MAKGEEINDAEMDSFTAGFRIGARFAYDIFCGDYVPLEGYLKD